MPAVINWLSLTYFMLEKAALVVRKVVPANTEFLSKFNEHYSVNKFLAASAVSKDLSVSGEKASGSLLDNMKVSAWALPGTWQPQQPRGSTFWLQTCLFPSRDGNSSLSRKWYQKSNAQY